MIKAFPILIIVASVGIISFLLIASTVPLDGGGVFSQLFHKKVSKAAAILPTNFYETLFASGLGRPTAMAFAPDGRLFVAIQDGDLRVIKNDVLLPTPFVTVNTIAPSEQGLLGVAFDPQFSTNHYIYVYYTTDTPAVHNRVSRFTANGDVAVAGSEQVIFELDNLSSAQNHNGGSIHFGLDEKLYIGVGENANSANSQDISNLLGKILRINPDGTIPTDNPVSFVNGSNQTLTPVGKNKAIHAIGFRNPFTFDVQPSTGKIYINDVGSSNTWRKEEVNQLKAGGNFGWPDCEGDVIEYSINPCPSPPFTNTVYNYGPGSDGNCAVTGGTFYNPTTVQFPSQYIGSYFFADYCAGWIKLLDTNNAVSTFASGGIASPVDLKTGPDGALYYLERGVNDLNGAVYKIRYGSTTPTPTPTTTPTVTPTPNQTPIPTITAPTSGLMYNAGDIINYAGIATDPKDGTLPASAFNWSALFHHDTHTHPFIGSVPGVKNGSFQIPTTGESSSNVWYRIHLFVTNSGGLTTEVTRDVMPRKANITLQTNPSGLQITLDGISTPTPYTESDVVNFNRTLGINSPQILYGRTYQFVSWSDSGAATHQISVPSTNTTYIATFQDITPTPSCPKSPIGDINCDGFINLFDYNILVTNFGKTVPKGTLGDLDNNGVVNLFDYSILVTNFGKK